jgi:hypothetical protein
MEKKNYDKEDRRSQKNMKEKRSPLVSSDMPAVGLVELGLGKNHGEKPFKMLI